MRRSVEPSFATRNGRSVASGSRNTGAFSPTTTVATSARMGASGVGCWPGACARAGRVIAKSVIVSAAHARYRIVSLRVCGRVL